MAAIAASCIISCVSGILVPVEACSCCSWPRFNLVGVSFSAGCSSSSIARSAHVSDGSGGVLRDSMRPSVSGTSKTEDWVWRRFLVELRSVTTVLGLAILGVSILSSFTKILRFALLLSAIEANRFLYTHRWGPVCIDPTKAP